MSSSRPPVPFFVLNDLEVVELGQARAVCTTEVGSWLGGTPEAGIHAGAAALADCVFSYAATTLMKPGLTAVTLNMRLDFWRRPPPVGTKLTGSASVASTDGDVLLVRGEVADSAGVVATGTLRSMLIPAGRPGPRPGGSASLGIQLVPAPDAGLSGEDESLAGIVRLPAARVAGLETTRCCDGSVELRCCPGRELERSEGVVHGGAVPVLGQLGCAAALTTALTGPSGARRLDTTVEYLRPTLVAQPVSVRSRVVHRSRRIVMTQSELVNDDGKPTARVYETAELDAG